MRATVMLADSAQAIDGKLYILGGGWTLAGPGPINMAIAIKIEIPWARANERIPWRLDLVDEDGHPIDLPGPPAGELQPFAFEGDLEAERPAGVRKGTPLDAAMAFNLHGLPLPAGGRYTWRFHADGETDEHWQCAFSTRPPEG